MAGRDGYVLAHDPEARITTRAYDHEGQVRERSDLGSVAVGRRPEREGSQGIIQVHEQDLGPLLRHMKEHQGRVSSWRAATSDATGPNGLQFVGRIPLYLIPFLNRMGILDDPQALREFMDSDYMKNFRTNPGIPVSRRGMLRKYGRPKR